MKKALITGITGQDGAYLSEFLLKKGYEVHGIKRRSSSFNTQRVDHLYQDPHVENKRFILHYGDLTDTSNLIRIIQQVQPNEIYNLGAQSHVQVSFEVPEYTADTDGIGTLRLFGSDSYPWYGKANPVLSGFYFGTLWQGAGNPSEGNNSFLSPQSLRCGEAVCLLDHGKLPGKLWYVCV